MPHARRNRAPKLEPELLDRSQGSTSLGGTALLTADDRGRVSGASVSQVVSGVGQGPTTIALCDGSQFTFTRLVDLRTSADA
jgi:hypothetical protein